MVYFLHSDEQIKEQNKILANCGKQFVPGIVALQGKRVPFTQISSEPTIPRFIDTKIIASYNSLSEATYEPTSTTAIRGDR